MTDRALLEEFAKLLGLLIRDFKLYGQVFRRKLKVAQKNVNRWREAKFWPNVDNWNEYERAAVEFAPAAERASLKARLAQIDELLRRKNAMKTPGNLSTALKIKASHADREVIFWHTFRERDADGKGVGNLIAAACERVVISGATLHQLVLRFEDDILAALERGVLMGIIRSRLTPDLRSLYEPYGRFDPRSLSTTGELYSKLCRKLSESQKKRFCLFETDLLLTHSIGLYDQELFVAEFVMHQHSEHSPSYMPPLHSSTHGVLLSEIFMLLTTAHPLFGDAQTDLLKSIERDLGRKHDL
jgi:hypothetical protein